MAHLLLVVLLLFTAVLSLRLLIWWTEPRQNATWLRAFFRTGFGFLLFLLLIGSIGFEIWLLLEWAGPVPEPTIQNTGIVFGTVLVIVHLLVLARFGRRGFWTFIEYAWLFLASVSILGAVSEYRRTSADDRLPMARASLRWRWEFAMKSVEEGIRLSGLRSPRDLNEVLGGGYDDRDPAELRKPGRPWPKVATRVHGAVTWMKSMSAAISEGSMPSVESYFRTSKISRKPRRKSMLSPSRPGGRTPRNWRSPCFPGFWRRD